MRRSRRNNISEEYPDNQQLVKRKINKKIGYGIFAVENIEPDQFLSEYKGKLMNTSDGIDSLENGNGRSFCYFFRHDGKEFCLDASNVEGMCKYVNDTRKSKANALMKKKNDSNGLPRLCLYSLKFINSGQEIRYDYGAPDQELWWRKEEDSLEPYFLSKIGCHCKEKTCSCIQPEADETSYVTIKSMEKNHLHDVIGKGSAATVHEFLWKGKIVAVKVFSTCISQRKMKKIAVSLAKLCHKNVVQYLGFIDQPQCLMMEFCKFSVFGEVVHNVKEMIDIWNDEKVFDLKQRLNIICQSAHGLIYLHNNGIVHRDFKPLNLLVSSHANENSFVIKLCDFDDIYGLKCTVTATQTNFTFKGCTLAYTANEICLRQTTIFDEKTDGYSFAITAYEILSDLQYPWAQLMPTNSDVMLLDILKNNERPHMSYLETIYGPCDNIFNIIKSCWHHVPEKRVALDMDVLTELEKAASHNKQENLLLSSNIEKVNVEQYNNIKEGVENVDSASALVSDESLSVVKIFETLNSKRKIKPEMISSKSNANSNDKANPCVNKQSTSINSNFEKACKKNDCNKFPSTNISYKCKVTLECLENQDGKTCQMNNCKELLPESPVDSKDTPPVGLEEQDGKTCQMNNCKELLPESPVDSKDTPPVGLEEQDGKIFKMSGDVDFFCSSVRSPEIISVKEESVNNSANNIIEEESIVQFPEQQNVLNDSGLQVDADVSVVDSPNVSYNEDNDNDTAQLNDLENPIEKVSKVDDIDSSTDPKTKKNEKKDCKINQSKSKKSKQVKPYKKPPRLCIFCKKMCSKLTLHIMLQHKHTERVKTAIKLKKTARIKEFTKMRREGIIEFNKNESLKEHPKYQSERQKKKYHDIVLCSGCSAFISKKFYHAHKRRCVYVNDKAVVGIPLYLKEIDSKKFSKQFINRVLSKMRDDDIGRIVRKDQHILYLGHKFYSKLKHKLKDGKSSTVENSVRSDMRCLAIILNEMRNTVDYNKLYGNAMDMFCRENFEVLCDAIDSLTTKDDEKKTMKAGLRQNFYFLLIKSCKKLRDFLFLEKEEDKSNELDAFLKCLKSNEDILVSNARYHLANTRLKKNRLPCNLPLKEDLSKMHNYISKRILELTDGLQFWTSHLFIELRNLVMTRLTLLNGRRGNEVSRLQLHEWEEAKEGNYLDNKKVENLSAEQKILVDALNITYISGKGNHHSVSILFPDDVTKALDILTDSEVRGSCGVLSDNSFVFASTQNSDEAFSGWHGMKDICRRLQLERPDLINATNNRHHLSTEYAGFDIPEKERELFYKHMGHSADMNRNVYQSPMALVSITKMGKTLLEIQAASTSNSKCKPKSKQVIDTSPGSSAANQKKSLTLHSNNKENKEKMIKKGKEDADCDSSHDNMTPESNSRCRNTTGKNLDCINSDDQSDSPPCNSVLDAQTDDNEMETLLRVSSRRKRKLGNKLKVSEVYTDESDTEQQRNVPLKRKRKIDKKCVGSDDSEYQISEDEESDEFEKKVVPKSGTRKSFRWTESMITDFNELYMGYVHRTEPKPMPTRANMEMFLKKHNAKAPFTVVRTRINNERNSLKTRTQHRRQDLNLK